MTICQLIQYFEVGGIERMVLALSRGAARAGVRSVVVGYAGDGDFRNAFTSAGIATQFLPPRFRPGSGGLRPDLVFQFADLLRRERCDVIHTHHVGPFIYGGAAAAIVGVPHVHTEHSRELYDRKRRQWIGRFMPRFARVVTVTSELSDWRRQHFGDDAEVVLNGVHVPPVVGGPVRTTARRQLDLPDDAFVVGCVARLSQEKDHQTLLDAVAILRQRTPNAALVLAGDGAERAELETRAGQADLAGAVRFLGSVTDVDQVYDACDVVALTSRREGLPLALLEAMAHGKPVVASAVGGIPALLEGGGGTTVPPGEPAQVAAALFEYATNDKKRRSDGLSARSLVTDHYSEGKMVERYLAMYRDAAARKAVGNASGRMI
ncbi:MAG: glycosyltransferase involved in cell wall biosynthesis [Myxococcota bacterium]|jgi:glycosyltransferase involved in cell wall biosynthesis